MDSYLILNVIEALENLTDEADKMRSDLQMPLEGRWAAAGVMRAVNDIRKALTLKPYDVEVAYVSETDRYENAKPPAPADQAQESIGSDVYTVPVAGDTERAVKAREALKPIARDYSKAMAEYESREERMIQEIVKTIDSFCDAR